MKTLRTQISEIMKYSLEEIFDDYNMTQLTHPNGIKIHGKIPIDYLTDELTEYVKLIFKVKNIKEDVPDLPQLLDKAQKIDLLLAEKDKLKNCTHVWHSGACIHCGLDRKTHLRKRK